MLDKRSTVLSNTGPDELFGDQFGRWSRTDMGNSVKMTHDGVAVFLGDEGTYRIVVDVAENRQAYVWQLHLF